MVQLGGVRLRHEIDRIPLWRGNHVGLKQLCEDMARYLYLPRIRDEEVLLAAVRDGLERLTWREDTFAYAEGWDEARGRYKGLRAGQSGRVSADSDSIIVKPEVAAAQFDADQEEEEKKRRADTSTVTDPSPTGTTVTPPPNPGTTRGKTVITPKPVPQLRRFHGSVKLDPVRLGRDASKIADEIVSHLSSIVGADVQIALDIDVDLPEGVSDKLVRDVTENCRTLHFEDYGFEES